jgi:DNA repair exonuclease SbcCD ATPase subunit
MTDRELKDLIASLVEDRKAEAAEREKERKEREEERKEAAAERRAAAAAREREAVEREKERKEAAAERKEAAAAREREAVEREKERKEREKERKERERERKEREEERKEAAAERRAAIAAHEREAAAYEKYRKEIAEAHKKAAKEMEDLRRVVNKVCGKIGDVEHNYGYEAEQFFQDIFEENKVFAGEKYDEMRPNFGRNDKVAQIEIDIALINGHSVALIEVKNRIHPDFVKEFAEKRVRKFRETYPEYDHYKIYLGIAGFSFNKTVLKTAKEYGVGIIRQKGERVELEVGELRAY